MYEYYEQLLQLKGVTTADVCKATGIGQATISTWKKRNNVLGAELLLKLAQYFGVPMEYFLGAKEVTTDFMVGDDLLVEVMTLNKSDKNRLREYVELLKKAGENK